MLKVYYEYTLLLAASLLAISSADCGCNKLNRNSIPDISDDSSEDTNETSPSKKYSRELNDNVYKDMVLIRKGQFLMGTNQPHFPADHEGPARIVTIENDFYMDIYEVSNQKFYNYVKETSYKTEAEKFGDSFVFEMSLPENLRNEYQDLRAVQAPWWIKLKGATWKHPEGRKTNIAGNCSVTCSGFSQLKQLV